MPINVAVPDNFLTQEELERLQGVLGVDQAGFETAVQRLVLAALAEYKQMLLGNGIPNRSDEIKQLRLYQLLRYYFEDRIPTEAEVSAMFQLTETQSRSLIRNTRSRYRQLVQEQLVSTLREVVRSARRRADAYVVVIQSDNVLEELNALIARNAPGLDPITKVKNASRTYEISEDSYEVLIQVLGLGPGVAGAQAGA